MTVAHSHTSNARAADPVLADFVEQFLQGLQAGEALDPTGFAAAHPEHAEPLRQLLPALEMMAALSHSAVPHGTSVAPAEDIAGPGLGVLGDFHILREVGRGGMGVVYEAEQFSLRRRVALKVLPFAAALDPRQLERFKSEAQATALLHHTNIVPVYAVGAERGVHYYAMQFIDGRTLADVISELRQLEGKTFERMKDEGGRMKTENPAASDSAASDRSDSSFILHPSSFPTDSSFIPHPSSFPTESRNRAYFRNVARLGIEAAEALEHAHQDGIIHRDIKPANLMVDAKGHLWVTDFGLARLKNDSGLTITGDLLGTLRYMSPESAAGGAKRVVIDARTDIYSLGVTLYELLTLEPAFDCPDRQELLRRIVEEDPRPPRKLDASIPRDLETILLKAIAKEPDGRYRTAQELADDLRRFLDEKPIRAKRPTALEQAVKWSRRHPTVVASSLVTLILAVAVLSVATVLISKEQAATKVALGLAIEQEQAAQTSAAEAQNQARWAGENASFMLQRIIEPFKKLANPDLGRDLAAAQARRDAVDEAVLVHEEMLKKLATRPGDQSQDEGFLIHIALLYTIADDHPKAQAAYAKAIDAAERRAREHTGIARFENAVAQTHSHLGMELWDVGKHADSLTHFRRAQEAFRRALALEPENVGIINNTCWFLSFFQDPAHRDPATALVLAGRLVSLTSEREHNRLHISSGMRPFFILGLAEYRVGDYPAARTALERSMELREGGDAYEWFVMAMVLARQGEIDRARKLHEQAVRWMKRYRYSDFELHFLNEETSALLGSTERPAPLSTSRKGEEPEQRVNP